MQFLVARVSPCAVPADIILTEIREKAMIERKHRIRHVVHVETSGLLVVFLFYLIQFHSLRLEAAHVDGKVVVLLLQQLHPKKDEMQPISMCLCETLFPADGWS